MLWSQTVGMGISSQIGLGPITWKKLQSFLVAAEAACSSGDLPVVMDDARLAAVEGLAMAAAVAAVPTELAAAVVLLPSATKKGAAHPFNKNGAPKRKNQATRLGLLPKLRNLLFTASHIKYTRCP